MSVSARTFQMLYILRQRSLKDLPTRGPDFAAFIAERRATSPQTYDKAYIGPAAIIDLLQRMTVENLVASTEGEYTFEFMGSQMADLLDGFDACSSKFIEKYKEQVVRAVLEQRVRLNQSPAIQRDVASVANISLDSARRGLETLINQGVVTETKNGRTATYTLVVPPVNTTTTITPIPVNDIRAALAGLDEGDILPGQTPVAEDPDSDNEECPVPLSAVLQDEGPDMEEVPPVETPEPEVTEVWNPWGWASVSEEVQQGHIACAKAAGVSLEGYFQTLLTKHQLSVRVALLGTT